MCPNYLSALFAKFAPSAFRTTAVNRYPKQSDNPSYCHNTPDSSLSTIPHVERTYVSNMALRRRLREGSLRSYTPSSPIAVARSTRNCAD
ncbi:hypothetical protein TNCV_1504261 [Trichonephila clavipes]|uniref:Uncharacterized protein n=1 Tax=Trichonephila clavipes TaxID=2585209 RepID=A0A8X6RYL9_TRICX|nr:hypothetical protein TNCV_1504261 [Trichonephila clavipes]